MYYVTDKPLLCKCVLHLSFSVSSMFGVKDTMMAPPNCSALGFILGPHSGPAATSIFKIKSMLSVEQTLPLGSEDVIVNQNCRESI